MLQRRSAQTEKKVQLDEKIGPRTMAYAALSDQYLHNGSLWTKA
jgi:hypothetical protein